MSQQQAGLLAFVGDSITADGRWDEWFPEESTLNLGVGGSTTDDVIRQVPEIVKAAPSCVIVMVGTNDLAWRRSAEYIVRNVETILALLRQGLPDAYLLVQSVLPRERDYAEVIREINRHLRQFAPSLRAQYLDLWPVFALTDGSLNPEFSDDNLHLGEAGYDAWLTELRPGLERLRNHPPMSSSIPLPPEVLSHRGWID